MSTVQPRLSELLIIQTRDAKKMQGQNIHCDHATDLRMHSKPTSRSCHARTSCCAAIKSSFNAQRSKINARYMYVFYQSRVRLKSTKCSISQLYICFCMHDRFRGCGLGVVNVIRTVRDFPLAKGARIIEVGLYPLNALFPKSAKICTCK